MHELSVALHIVEAFDEELAGEPENLNISTVVLQVGILTGLVPEAFEFSLGMATEGGLLQGSKLDNQVMDAAGYCQQCQVEQLLTNLQSMRCPACKEPVRQIMRGNELEILTVEVDDG